MHLKELHVRLSSLIIHAFSSWLNYSLIFPMHGLLVCNYLWVIFGRSQDHRLNLTGRNLTRSVVQTPAQLRVSCENKPGCSELYLIWFWKFGRRAMAKPLWGSLFHCLATFMTKKMFFIPSLKLFFVFPNYMHCLISSNTVKSPAPPSW